MSSLTIRVTDAQKTKLADLAREDGRTLSEFVRRQFETRILPAFETPPRTRRTSAAAESAARRTKRKVKAA